MSRKPEVSHPWGMIVCVCVRTCIYDVSVTLWEWVDASVSHSRTLHELGKNIVSYLS